MTVKDGQLHPAGLTTSAVSTRQDEAGLRALFVRAIRRYNFREDMGRAVLTGP